MKYFKSTLFALTLIMVGAASTVFLGFNPEYLYFSQLKVQNNIFYKAFVKHWYFGVAVSFTITIGFSLYYGEGWNEIDFTDERR